MGQEANYDFTSSKTSIPPYPFIQRVLGIRNTKEIQVCCFSKGYKQQFSLICIAN